jgi:hypothetical protein
MATRRQDQKPAEKTPPAYYIADQALFIDYVRAHNPGDQVPVDHVEKYGWADLVHDPNPPATGEQDKKTKPETAEGQASTQKEGDA